MEQQEKELPSRSIPEAGIAWMTEKTRHAVKYLADTYDRLRQQNSLSDDVNFCLTEALNYSMGVLAFLEERTHDPSDVDLVREEGSKGLRQLDVKYRDPTEYKQQRRFYNLGAFAQCAQELLCGERSPNRTLMHELLEGMQIDAPLIRHMKDLTEEVTMGRLEWGDYVREAKLLLENAPDEDPFAC